MAGEKSGVRKEERERGFGNGRESDVEESEEVELVGEER